MVLRLSNLALLASLAFKLVRADSYIFADGAGSLETGWENWSWSTTLTFSDTTMNEGSSSLYVVSTAYGALSLKDENTFGNSYAGMRFDISGDPTQIQIYLQSTISGGQSPTVPLADLNPNITSSKFTTVTMNFAALPPGGVALGNDTWNRINFQGLGNGASVSPRDVDDAYDGSC